MTGDARNFALLTYFLGLGMYLVGAKKKRLLFVAARMNTRVTTIKTQIIACTTKSCSFACLFALRSSSKKAKANITRSLFKKNADTVVRQGFACNRRGGGGNVPSALARSERHRMLVPTMFFVSPSVCLCLYVVCDDVR